MSGQTGVDAVGSVLFVCTGKICRSPIGERVARGRAATAGLDVSVASAGTGSRNGWAMHPYSIEVLTENGYDASDFRARYLLPRMLGEVDLVVGLAREHRAACQRMMPARWKRMFTLNEFVHLMPLGSFTEIIAGRSQVDTNAEWLDIIDPMGQPKADFERVFGEIEPAVGRLVEWLQTV
ncbi:MAG: low molecular weight phosphotyrosine protein phosphatase [Gordonia sp. (in: high G+C Gram-positive bacteria)]